MRTVPFALFVQRSVSAGLLCPADTRSVTDVLKNSGICALSAVRRYETGNAFISSSKGWVQPLLHLGFRQSR
jgi:hypothetical protein